MIYDMLRRRRERKARDELVLKALQGIVNQGVMMAAALQHLVAAGAVAQMAFEKLQRGVDEMTQAAGTLTEEVGRLTAEVANARGVRDSVLALINGIPAILQAAVDKALAAGATPAQLQSIQDAVDELANNDSQFVAAVQANAPPPAPAPAPSPAEAAGGSNAHNADAPADPGVAGGQPDASKPPVATG